MIHGRWLQRRSQDMTDPEICPIPDPASCTVLPWKPDTAWFASELDVIEGHGPYEACSRRILHRQVAKVTTPRRPPGPLAPPPQPLQKA